MRKICISVSVAFAILFSSMTAAKPDPSVIDRIEASETPWDAIPNHFWNTLALSQLYGYTGMDDDSQGVLDAAMNGNVNAIVLTGWYLVTFQHGDQQQLGYKYLRKACDLGHQRGCHEYGYDLLHGADNLEKDEEAGLEMLDGTCAKGVAVSCEMLTRYYFSPSRDSEKGLGYANRGCYELSFGPSCSAVGRYWLANGGADRDQKALDAHRRGCDFGYLGSCDAMGKMYAKGTGDIPVDWEKAKKYYRKACDGGWTSSCGSAGGR